MDITCPHCGVLVDVIPRANFTHEGYGYEILQCRGCNEVILQKNKYSFFQGNVTEIELEFQYPTVVPKLDDSIPDEVAEDYIEGMKCLGGGSPKGALTMFRRSLQTATRERGATPADLFNEIDELATKDIIPKDLKDLAHEIRLLGNDGAHPNRPNVSQDEALEVKDFIDHLFNYVYIMPARVTDMKNKRTQT